jgi:predicted glycogen debranching enzyme
MHQVNIKIENPDLQTLLYGEWLVANGLGGFACGSISGAPLRKYHALLLAALPAPYGRTIMLNYVADALILPDNREVSLSLLWEVDKKPEGHFSLIEFSLNEGMPVWKYQFEDIILEKNLFLVHKQNTLHISYKLLSAKTPLAIKWRPYLHFRNHEQHVDQPNKNETYAINVDKDGYSIALPPYPTLRLYNKQNPPFTLDSHTIEKVFYEIEARRGYSSVGSLTSPGYFLTPINLRERITFIASIEPWKTIHVLTPTEAWITEKQRRRTLLRMATPITSSLTASKLVLAADQFIMTPSTRDEDMIRMQAAGEEVRSIIAGFPWFTDWGRDTMISLEGLTLTTGRSKIAHSILRTFAFYIKDGLIPNMFPDGENKALYNTADATLWFFHAVDRYIQLTGDDDILELLLPKFQHIIEHHIKGTLFGIKVDQDGLLMQGQKGVQLTWMDAKVGDWVVTPRRGKAVEINALWYNALKLMDAWTGKPTGLAEQCYESFNNRFWYEKGQYLYDVIDGENGDDPALRPNQLFAISLKHPVLEKSRWKPVLDIVHKDLLTPVGLRTLSPSHPDFKTNYDGDLRARDAAYHQGTVWPWLLGPFIDVWLKVYPNDFDTAHQFLKGLEEHLESNCMGTIGEVFDACDPYHARGCFAQAWSVAEFLRTYVKTKPDIRDKGQGH